MRHKVSRLKRRKLSTKSFQFSGTLIGQTRVWFTLFFRPTAMAIFIVCASSCANSANKPTQDTVHTEAMNTSNNVDEDLDLLSDYDRELWDGPDKWTDKQWYWKRTLKWDRACDYVAEVDTREMTEALWLVQVMCVPGAYQPTYYLYLFAPAEKRSLQLALGAKENTDIANNVSGDLRYDSQHKKLHITTLSRGLGDCGVYQVYGFSERLEQPTLLEKRRRDCSEQPLPDNPPQEIFDARKWPRVDENNDR